MADLKKLAEEIVGLTLLEAQELKTILKDEYGIEPAAGGAVMMAGPADGGGGAAADHQPDRGWFGTAAGGPGQRPAHRTVWRRGSEAVAAGHCRRFDSACGVG